MNAEIDLLLARYFSGEASSNELARLEDWLSQSEANQLHFEEMTSLYERVAMPQQPIREPDMEKALSSFLQYMHQHTPNDHGEAKPIRSEGRPSVGAFRKLRRRWAVFAAAASVLLLLTLSIVQYLQDLNTTRIMSFGGEVEHTLPDGTHVVLSKNSQLEYKKGFGTTNRTLYLTGEAFVEVGSGGKGKFLLKVGETTIEDIGTAFTVTAWPNADDISVTVKEGTVLFYTETDKGIRIEGGQLGSFRKSTRSFTTPAADTSSQSLSRHLVFNATPLHEVVGALNLLYHAKISVANNVKDKTITVEFDNQDLDIVLEVIAQTLQLRISGTGTSVLLY